jgi:hypothetical protein
VLYPALGMHVCIAYSAGIHLYDKATKHSQLC